MASTHKDADAPGAGGTGSKRQGFLLRLPPDLLEELRAWAAQDLRSLNAQIEFLLRQAVRKRRSERSAE
jgi:hypothetical protein